MTGSLEHRTELAGASLRMDRVRKSFGQTLALADLTLEVLPGELMALLGPSGCGKTTALRIIAGFLSPERGSVYLGGRDISHLPPQSRNMGMVFQSYSLFPNMTVEDNVGFGLRVRGWKRALRRRRSDETLELVGLAELRRRYPHELSGGQQQRVALARALAIRPGVLLLDEPLSALDAKVRLAIREEIRALQRRLGITTVFVTHDQEEALSMADRVCVMRDGNVMQLARPEELYASPTSSFVADFVGVMNRLAGRLSGSEVHVLGTRRAVRGTCGVLRAAGEATVDVLVRPESLAVRAAEPGDGVVTATTFLGASLRVTVATNDGRTVRADVHRNAMGGIVPGATVSLEVLDESVVVDTPSGTSEPGTSEPGTSEPGTSEPGTSEPGTSGSGTSGLASLATST